MSARAPEQGRCNQRAVGLLPRPGDFPTKSGTACDCLSALLPSGAPNPPGSASGCRIRRGAPGVYPARRVLEQDKTGGAGEPSGEPARPLSRTQDLYTVMHGGPAGHALLDWLAAGVRRVSRPDFLRIMGRERHTSGWHKTSFLKPNSHHAPGRDPFESVTGSQSPPTTLDRMTTAQDNAFALT